MGLETFAEVFEDDVADDGGDEADGEVGGGEDVGEGEWRGFAGGVGTVELAHEQVGVEEEDDEADLDRGAEDSREGAVGRRRRILRLVDMVGGGFDSTAWMA